MTTISRKRLFSAAHFYSQKKISPAENLAVFGRCHTPYGHGHNYVVEVFVALPPQLALGSKIDLGVLDQCLFDACDELDHQHLNFDIAHFKDLVPTTENIALYLRDKLIDALATRFADSAHSVRLQRLRLFETDDLWVELWEA